MIRLRVSVGTQSCSLSYPGARTHMCSTTQPKEPQLVLNLKFQPHDLAFNRQDDISKFISNSADDQCPFTHNPTAPALSAEAANPLRNFAVITMQQNPQQWETELLEADINWLQSSVMGAFKATSLSHDLTKYHGKSSRTWLSFCLRPLNLKKGHRRPWL